MAREETSLYLNWDRFETNDTAVDALDAYFNDVYSFDLKALADEETQSAQAVPDYRVQDQTPELGMIFDPCFRDLMATSKLPGQIQLSKNWVVALQAKEAGTHGQVRAEPLKGLRISWEGTPKLVQLWQDLEFGAADPDIAVDIEVTLTLQTVADHPKLIDYVVIEKHTAAGWAQEKLRLTISSQGEDGVVTVVGRTTAFQLEQEQNRLRIQFTKDPKTLILRSVVGTLSAHPQSLLPLAVEPEANGRVLFCRYPNGSSV